MAAPSAKEKLAMDEYKKRTNTGDDVIIRLHRCQTPPPPTAVLFGWLGAKHNNLSKYSAIYRSLGYNTVQLIAPASTIFALHPRSHSRFLLSVLRILSADARLTSGGLVFHFFSNGGAILSPHLSALFTSSADLPDDADVVRSIKASFCGLVFDSSPCYLHPSQGATAINEGLRIPPPFTYLLTLSFILLCLFQKLFVIDLKHWFWDRLTHARYPCPENYIYSTADHLLDADRLDDLIRSRQSRGTQISVFRVHDAGHVLILRKHPDKYAQLIRSVNDGSVNNWRRRNHLDPWFPHPDPPP